MFQDKKPYLDKVAELKAEYEKAMESYKAGEVEEVCFSFIFVLWAYISCYLFIVVALLF